MSQHQNRLARETSPYLLQHALNPVDWHPWGPEALALARERNCPIFLSIGYSACHWCHVMERESFEDEATAALLNELFVCIKVDREERPDLDQIYMAAVQAVSGRGGWPMSVWLTPDQRPFHGGTYYPPAPRHGMPSFRDVCRRIAEVWNQDRPRAEAAAAQLVGVLQEVGRATPSAGELSNALLTEAAGQLARHFDPVHGGLGSAPKFPHAVEIRLLLQAAELAGREDWRRLALLGLEKMAAGGIRDHLGGGFHRYSTDREWLAPHFEKMLYDQALLVPAYVEAWQLTGAEVHRAAACETCDYVLREMQGPDGPFHSAQDADSEGEEGKFFVWSKAEVAALLGPDAEDFAAAYDVTEAGNWEGTNILRRLEPLAMVVARRGGDEAALAQTLAHCRRKLLAARGERIPPLTDDKAIAAWNGMMIDGLCQAAQAFGEPRYAAAAARAADGVLLALRRPDGGLHRTVRAGQAKHAGLLDDYAALANGLVSLYETTFEARRLQQAAEMMEQLLARFWDDAAGGCFYTPHDHEPLVARGKDPQDGATPSGNALATLALVRLAGHTGRADFAERAEQMLRLFRGQMAEQPQASAQLLLALRRHLGPTDQVAIVGRLEDAETQAALRALHGSYRPNKTVAAGVAGDVPLLAGKPVGVAALVHLCEGFACSAPVSAAAFAAHWGRLPPAGA